MDETELLDELRRCPTNYLGARSLVRLVAFLAGFDFPKYCAGDQRGSQAAMAFQAWVRQRYQVNSSQGVERILLLHSEDDRAAFHLFWKLYDEYQADIDATHLDIRPRDELLDFDTPAPQLGRGRFDEVLAELQRAPCLYIASRSITRLTAFIDGYCLSHAKSSDFSSTDYWHGLQGWIHERYRVRTPRGIDRVILFYSSDERDAFDEFWSLLDEYKRQYSGPTIEDIARNQRIYQDLRDEEEGFTGS